MATKDFNQGYWILLETKIYMIMTKKEDWNVETKETLNFQTKN